MWNPYLWLLTLLEESLLTRLVRLLLPGEVALGADLVDNGGVNGADVNSGPGGDNVAGVDAADGDTVNLEGAGNEEDTLGEGLEEDNALATEATGEKDQDGTGLERGAGLVCVLGLADLEGEERVSGGPDCSCAR